MTTLLQKLSRQLPDLVPNTTNQTEYVQIPDPVPNTTNPTKYVQIRTRSQIG
jgi:hypothetical protein